MMKRKKRKKMKKTMMETMAATKEKDQIVATVTEIATGVMEAETLAAIGKEVQAAGTIGEERQTVGINVVRGRMTIGTTKIGGSTQTP